MNGLSVYEHNIMIQINPRSWLCYNSTIYRHPTSGDQRLTLTAGGNSRVGEHLLQSFSAHNNLPAARRCGPSPTTRPWLNRGSRRSDQSGNRLRGNWRIGELRAQAPHGDCAPLV
jgi:hypothetical protein